MIYNKFKLTQNDFLDNYNMNKLMKFIVSLNKTTPDVENNNFFKNDYEKIINNRINLFLSEYSKIDYRVHSIERINSLKESISEKPDFSKIDITQDLSILQKFSEIKDVEQEIDKMISENKKIKKSIDASIEIVKQMKIKLKEKDEVKQKNGMSEAQFNFQNSLIDMLSNPKRNMNSYTLLNKYDEFSIKYEKLNDNQLKLLTLFLNNNYELSNHKINYSLHNENNRTINIGNINNTIEVEEIKITIPNEAFEFNLNFISSAIDSYFKNTKDGNNDEMREKLVKALDSLNIPVIDERAERIADFKLEEDIRKFENL